MKTFPTCSIYSTTTTITVQAVYTIQKGTLNISIQRSFDFDMKADQFCFFL